MADRIKDSAKRPPVRMIVECHGAVSRAVALSLVARVISEGRISEGSNGSQYCHITAFEDGTKVYATRNKASDRFTVWKPRSLERTKQAENQGKQSP